MFDFKISEYHPQKSMDWGLYMYLGKVWKLFLCLWGYTEFNLLKKNELLKIESCVGASYKKRGNLPQGVHHHCLVVPLTRLMWPGQLPVDPVFQGLCHTHLLWIAFSRDTLKYICTMQVKQYFVSARKILKFLGSHFCKHLWRRRSLSLFVCFILIMIHVQQSPTCGVPNYWSVHHPKLVA